MMKQTLINKINFIVLNILSRLFKPEFRQLSKIKIYNSLETIDAIASQRLSMSRFGDGELALMSGNDTGFQEKDDRIISKLKTILTTETPGLIVGLPHVWKYPWKLKYRAYEFWGAFLSKNLSANILPSIDINKEYYDTNFTRFYIDYRSKSNAKKVLKKVRKIWDKRNICFIEGEYSRLGVGNDLFENASSITRILCPARNAFDVYDRILSEAGKQPKDTLFLIALGMTATCLAYDLHQQGYQAIDIGHIDIEYEWFLMRAKDKVAVPGKFVAESTDNSPEAKTPNTKYESQIIARVL